MQDAGGTKQPAATPGPSDLARKVAALFLQVFGDHPGYRLAHAKGIVCHGRFEPAAAAREVSRAPHFRGGAVPVVARFSDGTGLPQVADGDPHANPKGLAIRFNLPDGGSTDIVANGLNGFVVGAPADFVSFFSAVAATKPDSPHPTPLEQFLAAHPASAAFLTKPNPTPASFATQAYFGNNAFIFVNAQGHRQATRYQIVPAAGAKHLDPAAVAGMPPDFLFDELRARIAKTPVQFRILAQLAEPGDSTSDATNVWPEPRRKVELGTLSLTGIDPQSAKVEKALIMDPVHLLDGIELSDDPLPRFRSEVYALSYARRA